MERSSQSAFITCSHKPDQTRVWYEKRCQSSEGPLPSPAAKAYCDRRNARSDHRCARVARLSHAVPSFMEDKSGICGSVACGYVNELAELTSSNEQCGIRIGRPDGRCFISFHIVAFASGFRCDWRSLPQLGKRGGALMTDAGKEERCSGTRSLINGSGSVRRQFS